jgi:hypothetical protein
MAAYARLRANDVQPPSIDGSAELEKRADTALEVASGQVLSTKKQRQQLASLAKDIPT